MIAKLSASLVCGPKFIVPNTVGSRIGLSAPGQCASPSVPSFRNLSGAVIPVLSTGRIVDTCWPDSTQSDQQALSCAPA